MHRMQHACKACCTFSVLISWGLIALDKPTVQGGLEGNEEGVAAVP